MNTLKQHISNVIKEKHFPLIAYLVILSTGIGFILWETMSVENLLGVKIIVFIRITLFFLNITFPYILWQQFYSTALYNHSKRRDNRKYIWKARFIIFKHRMKYAILYFISALAIAVFSLKTFSNSYIEEAFLLFFLGTTTLFFPLILLYLFSYKYILHSYKNTRKDKIYSPIYIRSIEDENIIDKARKSSVNLTETPSTNGNNLDIADIKEQAITENEINPNSVFKTKMYEKLEIVEKELQKDNYLNDSKEWIAVHPNKIPNIQELVVFISQLMDHNYFLPNKDLQIKKFFEARYSINIGQSFEKRRRETIIKDKPLFNYAF